MKIEVQDDHWIVTVSVVLADAVTMTAGIVAYCKRVGFCGTEACPQNEHWKRCVGIVGSWIRHRKAIAETFAHATGICANELRKAAARNELEVFCLPDEHRT